MLFKDKEIIDRLATIDRKLDMIITMQKTEKIKKASKEAKKNGLQ